MGRGVLRYISDGGGAKSFFGFQIRDWVLFVEFEIFLAEIVWEERFRQGLLHGFMPRRKNFLEIDGTHSGAFLDPVS